MVEFDPGQRRSPPDLESSRQVSYWHSQHQPCVRSPEPAQESTPERPAHRVTTWDITRTKDQIRLSCRRDKRWQRSWIVRKIRVHLGDEIRRKRQRPVKPGYVGRSQPALQRPVNDVDPPRVRGREGIGQFTRAIGRVVIDDDESILRARGKYAVDERFQIWTLVVRRHDDDDRGTAGQGEAHVALGSAAIAALSTENWMRGTLVKSNDCSRSGPTSRSLSSAA